MSFFSRISTPPQQCSFINAAGVTLGKVGSASFRIENKAGSSQLVKTAELRLKDTLRALLGTNEEGKGALITLSLDAPPCDVKNAEQAYCILTQDNKVTLTGFGELGLLYACISFCQLLKVESGDLSIPAFRILDWPDIERRGHLVECRYGSNLMTLNDWKSVVDDLLSKKQNSLTVALYGCWCVQYDGLVSEYLYLPFDKYPKLKTPVMVKYYSPETKTWVDEQCLPPMFEQDFFGELIAYAKENGIEVIPFFNTYGHNTLIPDNYPELASKFPDGTSTHNSFCTSNPKVYELLFHVFDTIIEKYLVPNGITSFDIGLDEVGDDDFNGGSNAKMPYKLLPAFCSCEKCINIPQHKKFIDHAIKLISYLKGKGMKNIYIYQDMFYSRFRPADKDYLPLFTEELRKNGLLDVTVMNWWGYSDIEDLIWMDAKIIKTCETRVMLKPMNGYYHWNVLRPSVKNSYILAQMAHDVKPYAYSSYSAWDKSLDRTNALQAEQAWSFATSGSVADCTERYAERLFSTKTEEALRAFTLLDFINEQRNEKYENGCSVLSSRVLIERWLAYYFYSYINIKLPYPRSFPGEAMSKLLENRAEAERLLYYTQACAAEAADIFGRIAEDPACDRKMALRYRWEAGNFLCLTDDFITLLRIHDILARGANDESAARMISLARGRKEARLLLMAQFGEVKEDYLKASHLRNQSIFMQFFADLEAYLQRTPASDICLDFTDFSPIESAQFKHLR